MDYAVVDGNGVVVNVVLWDGISQWGPPAGHIAVPLKEGGIGWSYTKGKFVPPPEPPVESDEQPEA